MKSEGLVLDDRSATEVQFFAVQFTVCTRESVRLSTTNKTKTEKDVKRKNSRKLKKREKTQKQHKNHKNTNKEQNRQKATDSKRFEP